MLREREVGEGGEPEDRNGKWRLSGCRGHEPPACGGHDQGWLPSTRWREATGAMQTPPAGSSLTRLWRPRPLPLTGPASARGPCFSPLLSALPHCWLRPPATTHVQHFLALNKEKQTCGAMSPSRNHLPPSSLPERLSVLSLPEPPPASAGLKSPPVLLLGLPPSSQPPPWY